MLKLIASIGLLALLCGCAGSAAVVEPQQTRPLDGRQGRMYFTRATGLVGSLAAAEIRVDGTSVGRVDGDTHLVVDRPAGRHTISVYFIGLLATNVQHEAVVQIQAGTSTYFEVRQAETNTRATGRPVAGTAPNLFMFYELDPGTGAAAVARTKAGG